MSHRGRLNVMVNTFGKSPADIFSKFEDVNPRSILGGGDVKYHVGATGQFLTRSGGRVACIWYRIPATWKRWIRSPWAAPVPSRFVWAKPVRPKCCRCSSMAMRHLPARASGQKR